MCLSIKMLRKSDLQVFRVHRKTCFRNLQFGFIVESSSASLQTWTYVFQPCETIHRVRNLSSPLFRWYFGFPSHKSLVNPCRNSGSFKMIVRYAAVRPDKQGMPPSMCVEEAISIFLIVSRMAARTSHMVILCPTGCTRWDVPTPPIFWSSKHARTYGRRVGGQIASSSAKTMMSVVVFRIPCAICKRLLANGTVRTRILEGSTDRASSSSGPLIRSSVTIIISFGFPSSHECAASTHVPSSASSHAHAQNYALTSKLLSGIDRRYDNGHILVCKVCRILR